MSIVVEQTFGGNWLVPPPLSGVREFGVPTGGAFDPVAAECARLLSGASEGTTVLELVAPVVLRAQDDLIVGLADAGEPFAVDERKLTGPGRLVLRSGSKLELPAPRLAYRRYVCWSGLRCHSKLPVPLTEGASLYSQTLAGRARSFKLAEQIVPDDRLSLRIVTDHTISRDEFIVSPQMNRAGIRLSGAIEGQPALGLSEPSVLGAVQVTPSGELLIHGPDGPTIGGYPKIGVIAQADLRRVSYLRPGDRARLIPISIAHALNLLTDLEETKRRLVGSIQLAISTSAVD